MSEHGDPASLELSANGEAKSMVITVRVRYRIASMMNREPATSEMMLLYCYSKHHSRMSLMSYIIYYSRANC